VAASKARLKVSGLAEVNAALHKVERSAQDMTDAHRRIVSSILPGVASRTPRRSGDLASSWSAGATKTRGRVLSSLAYAGPIEWGDAKRNVIGAHMVSDTIDDETPAIVAGYSEELERAGRAAGFEVRG
jgi:hypothetical protein